jgi:hypothetical protein
MTEDARYPIGRLQRETALSTAKRAELVADLEKLPASLRETVAGFTSDDWGRSYRSGGWTARQIVHHLADSHLQLSVRVRLALTEDTPTIKPYREALWAELPDAREADPALSIELLETIHRRVVHLLQALPDGAFARAVYHPEQGRTQTIDEMIGSYAWHGRHHLAHLITIRDGSPGG